MRVFGQVVVVLCLGIVTLARIDTQARQRRAPLERSGANGVPASDGVRGSGGRQSPGLADAASIFGQAREALGGDKKLAEVKTFVVTGRTRKIQGNNLVPVEFEIAVELPDKYVRKDEIPAQESGPTSLGFNGDEMIQLPVPVAPPPRAGGAPPAGARPGGPPATAPATPPGAARAGEPPARGASPTTPPPSGGTVPPAAGTPPGIMVRPPDGAAGPGAPAAGVAGRPGGPGMPPGGRGGAPPIDPRKARVYAVKQDFVKLTLGMFAASFSSYPLTFTVGGQAEAPQGKADVIDIKGDGNLSLRFFINSQTHLPIMVSWTTPATNVVMTLPGQPAPKDIPPGSVVVEAPPLPPPTAPKEEQDKYAKDVQALRAKALATAKPVENRIYYADYRDAGNGLMFPFRHRRAIAGETVEETAFDQFRINVRIDPRKFEVPK